MDKQEKEKMQRMIKQNLKGIEFAIQKSVELKNNFRKSMDTLTSQKDTYTPEYLEKEIEKTKVNHATKMRTAYDDIVSRLEELRGLIAERDTTLNLQNPALMSALTLIQMGGSELSYETAKMINENFSGDQPSLRAIQMAYKSQGVVQTAGLGKMIYDANETIDLLKSVAFAAFVQQGSLNYFAGEVAKLASLEGQEIAKTPDEVGAVETMRRAAGLD